MRLAKLAVAAVFALGFGRAYAFHDGGVAYCEGCHVMHNASNGVDNKTFDGTSRGKAIPGAKASQQAPWTNLTNQYLLQGTDQSSTCLMCHAAGTGGYHIFDGSAITAGNAPGNYTPGGDFVWLLKSFSWTTSYGSSGSSPGNAHGHNIKAVDFSLVPKTGKQAPGGTYPADLLSCISCHDPHPAARIMDANGTIALRSLGAATKPIAGSGSYGGLPTATEAVGVYRILGGNGYLPDSSLAGTPQFTVNPPVAVAPSTYNQIESTPSAEVHVAYGAGMSEWCANCHTNIHNDTYPAVLRHPAGNGAKLAGTPVVANYNAYVMSGNLTGSQTTSYTSMVPYEEGTTVLATLAARATNASTAASTTGPTGGNENVMCLSCHRAHATGWDKGTRWNHMVTYITADNMWPGTNASGTEAVLGEYANGRTQAETQAAMYGRASTVYATFQRQLCNKCHAKD